MGIYADLLRQGWTLPEIDGMDFPFFMRLIAYLGNSQNQSKYIDDIL